MTDRLTVTVTPADETRHARAVFVWSDDMQDCDVTAFGFEDDELEALIASKAHEGTKVEGYVVAVD